MHLPAAADSYVFAGSHHTASTFDLEKDRKGLPTASCFNSSQCTVIPPNCKLLWFPSPLFAKHRRTAVQTGIFNDHQGAPHHYNPPFTSFVPLPSSLPPPTHVTRPIVRCSPLPPKSSEFGCYSPGTVGGWRFSERWLLP